MIIKDEVHGKTLDEIQVTNYHEWRCVTIRFTDKTSIHFTLKVKLTVEPELSDWKTGNDKILKQFRSVKESTI